MAIDFSAHNDPHSLATLPDILSRLSSLQSAEAELSVSLTSLLNSPEPIVESLTRLQSLAPSLNELHDEAHLLSRTVSTTAKTADHVGGRVRSLDEEMRRVREAAERVGLVLELKSSIASLQSAMEAKDWESATRHCARAMTLPLDITPENHLPPAQALQNAREELLQIFTDEFEKASQSRDAAATSRFFKLFPEIGWENEGLQLYASFVVDLVRVRAPPSSKTSSPLYYVTALTALFESIALIIDQHQPVVEKYYGPGKMLRVLDRLLQESGRVTKDLLEGWEEQREMKRKVQKCLQHGNVDETDAMDPRDVDKVLSEAADMGGRWSLFRKFLYASQTTSTAELSIVETSTPRQLFSTMLATYYVPLEIWYTRTVIDKTHQLSRIDVTQSPAVTTTPDDAFYILKIVMSRMLSTGSVAVVDSMISTFRDILDQDYISVLKKRLDDVYRSNGATGHAKSKKTERDNRQSFIVILNDLDISSAHLDRLLKDICVSSLVTQNFMSSEIQLVRNQIMSMASLVPKFKTTLRAGIEQLFNQLLRPKLRSFISDLYKDVSYILDEDAYAAADYQDVVRKRFVKAWESLIDGYKEMFTPTNFGMFFGLALDILIRPWEKYVLTMKYSELGAIRFDHDLRSITSYLLSQTVFGDVRGKFTRLQQISTLLNLDLKEDAETFFNESGIVWQLTQQEASLVTSLRL